MNYYNGNTMGNTGDADARYEARVTERVKSWIRFASKDDLTAMRDELAKLDQANFSR